MNNAIREHYLTLYRSHGDSFLANQYSSLASQELRFAVLSELADLNGSKVLDWGCGTAHFATWLKYRGVSCHYTGVDVVDELITLDRKKHPTCRFGHLDDFRKEIFDWCLISGVFNNRRSDNKDFFERSIRQLWKMVDKGMAFNLLSTRVDYREKALWYARPEKVLNFVLSITPYVKLRNEYLMGKHEVPFEFTVYMYKSGTKLLA